MRTMLRFALGVATAVALALSTLGSGCEPHCADSCSNDEDCGGSLVCYSGQCAPKECRERCLNPGLNVCMFNRLTCTYMSCD